MAIQNRRGNEADFDPSKMLPGEWAVSLDTKYVRMCFAPGVCLRMATYEAFETDMDQIAGILGEVQSEKEAVERIQAEVNNAAIEVERYVETAKGHSNTSKSHSDVSKQHSEQSLRYANNAHEEAERAKTYAENASAVTGVEIAKQKVAGLVKGGENYIAEDGTLQLTKQTAENTLPNSYSGGIKINSIAGAIKQNQYSGKNLIPLPHDVTYPYVNYGITFDYDKETGYITANGTANSTVSNYSVLNIQNRNDTKTPFCLPKGRYIITGCPSGGSGTTYRIAIGYTNVEGTYTSYVVEYGKGAEFEVTDETRPLQVQLTIQNGYTANNLVFKPMIRRADIEDDTFEPWVGNVPSPNPDYPQEIQNVELGEIKTVGKNLIPYPHDYAYPYTNHGVTFTYDEETGYITANGTANSTVSNYSVLNIQNRNDTKTPFCLPKGRYIITGCPSGGSGTTYRIAIGYTNTEGTYTSYVVEYGKGAEFEVTDETRPLQVQLTIQNGYTANNLVFKPMIRRADIEDDTFEPYKASTASITFTGRAIEVTADDDYTYEKDGKYYIADTIGRIDGGYQKVQRIDAILSYNGESITSNYISTTGGLDIGAEVHYILSQPITTQLSDEESTAILSLKSFDDVTHISTDSKLQPIIDVEYGTSIVGAYTLDALNTAQKNEIRYASLATLTNSLATALVAGSEG